MEDAEGVEVEELQALVPSSGFSLLQVFVSYP